MHVLEQDGAVCVRVRLYFLVVTRLFDFRVATVDLLAQPVAALQVFFRTPFRVLAHQSLELVRRHTSVDRGRDCSFRSLVTGPSSERLWRRSFLNDDVFLAGAAG